MRWMLKAVVLAVLISNISKACVLSYEHSGTISGILTFNDTKIWRRILKTNNNWATIRIRGELRNVSMLPIITASGEGTFPEIENWTRIRFSRFPAAPRLGCCGET